MAYEWLFGAHLDASRILVHIVNSWCSFRLAMSPLHHPCTGTELCSREPWAGHARSSPVSAVGKSHAKGHPVSSGWQSPTLGPMDWNARWAHGLWNQEIEKDQASTVKERWRLEFIQIHFIDPTTIQQLTLPSWPTPCQHDTRTTELTELQQGLTAWGWGSQCRSSLHIYSTTTSALTMWKNT